jgi:RNA polymerase sigma-70 factor (ECF subfamily)
MDKGRESHGDASSLRPSRWFATTQWNVVLAAGSKSSPDADQALAQLLETYWLPLYAFVRRRGYSPDDSCDLVQGFLLQFLGHDRLRLANPERGRFRSFLLSSLSHFLANEEAARGALKRGGGAQVLSLSAGDMEQRLEGRSPDHHTPELAFDRHWALTLLEVGLRRLREEQQADGRAEAFDLLKPCLEGDPPDQRYYEIARRLNTTESARKMRVLRLRRRYRSLLLEEIGRTLDDPSLAEAELQSLLCALRGEQP